MTKMRLAKAQRLLKLNREMQKLEEEKLATARGQKLAVQAEQDSLIDALSSGGAKLQALPTPMVLQRLRKLDDQKRALETEITAGATVLRTVMTRAKYSERLTKQYEMQHRRASEGKELQEVIERVLRKGDVSLP